MLPCGPRARADLRQMGYNSLLFSFNIHFYGLDKLPILNIMKVRVWPWSNFDFIRINFSKLQNVKVVGREKISISKDVNDKAKQYSKLFEGGKDRKKETAYI